MGRDLLTRAVALVVCMGLLAGMWGCGPSDVARTTVRGQVKIGDKNLTAGTVTFTSQESKEKKFTGSATIGEDGSYVMKDAPIGEVAISVTVPKVMGFGGKMPKMPKMPADASMKAGDKEMTTGISSVDPTKVVPIPDKYSNPETSLLTYKVEKGEQTHNITLTK